MKQERIILSFIMVLIGLLVAGTAFYFYQGSKKASSKNQFSILATPTPLTTKETSVFLKIDNPKDESVVNSKSLLLTGKTNPGATVLVITSSDQQVLTPNTNGEFSTTLTLGTDQNLINVISILANGDSKLVKETVTYSTTSF